MTRQARERTSRIHPPNPVRSADDVKNPGRKCYRLAIIVVIRLKNGESLNRYAKPGRRLEVGQRGGNAKGNADVVEWHIPCCRFL
jgi:hypothetical protein